MKRGLRRRNVMCSDGDEIHSQVTATVSPKSSPRSRCHGKYTADCEFETQGKKKVKKKSLKKYPSEVVRFVEGAPDPESNRWKSPRYNTEIRYLEHKYIQCNIEKTNEDVEMILPEEIKPLLINVTFLLHELKQKSDSKNHEDLCNVISKIASLLAELTRRPIKRSEETSKGFDEIADNLNTILRQHNGPESQQYEKLLTEIKRLEQEVAQKDCDVNYVKEQIQEERERFMPEPTCLDDSLRNSIRKNQSLKAEIKYNKAQIRKYEKILLQKEQLRQKSLFEVNNLRRKCARLEQNVESNSKPAHTRIYHADSDVLHGGSLTKYIKSKVNKESKFKSKVTKNSTIHANTRKAK